MLEGWGARAECCVLDASKHDMLLHHHPPPTDSHGRMPLLLLLVGPRRFLRNRADSTEASIRLQQRVVQRQLLRGFSAVLWLSQREWRQAQGSEAKARLLRDKASAQGARLEDYCRAGGGG